MEMARATAACAASAPRRAWGDVTTLNRAVHAPPPTTRAAATPEAHIATCWPDARVNYQAESRERMSINHDDGEPMPAH